MIHSEFIIESMRRNLFPAFPLMFIFFSAFGQASDQVGTLTQVSGPVTLLTHPSKTVPADKEENTYRVSYEGLKYIARSAHAGDRLEQGNILRTLPGAEARIVFDNGDQYNVGSATEFKIQWKQDSPSGEKAAPSMDLAYGKIRAVVSKGGPRKFLRIRTKTAVMGVRGTDFFISSGEEGSTDFTTEVSTLRGTVYLRGLETAAAQSAEHDIEVKPGNTGVAEPAETAGQPKVQIKLRRTTKQDLADVAQVSKIQRQDPGAFSALEEKASATVLEDIKAGDPTLFAQISQQKVQTSEEANRLAVEKLLPTAPAGAARRKPRKGELEDSTDVYDKYYKIKKD